MVDGPQGVDVSVGADGKPAGTYPVPYVRDWNAQAFIGWSTYGGRGQTIPAPVAQEVMRARDFKRNHNVVQKRARPAYDQERFHKDPTGIIGTPAEYQKKANHFQNLALRGIGAMYTNTEQTSLGKYVDGIAYTPRGLGMRRLLPPGKPEHTNDTTPIFRGY